MIQFISSIKKEVDVKIKQIEYLEISILTKSLEASSTPKYIIWTYFELFNMVLYYEMSA